MVKLGEIAIIGGALLAIGLFTNLKAPTINQSPILSTPIIKISKDVIDTDEILQQTQADLSYTQNKLDESLTTDFQKAALEKKYGKLYTHTTTQQETAESRRAFNVLGTRGNWGANTLFQARANFPRQYENIEVYTAL